MKARRKVKSKVKKEDAAYFDQVLKNAPEESVKYVDKSMEIGDRIWSILHKKGITQKALAEKLGKKEAEISRWVGGPHNFTIRTIVAIEAALGEELITVPRRV